MIAAYEYYVNSYLGNQIRDEIEYLRLAGLAERYLKRFTANQAFDITKDIQDAVCAVCDILAGDRGEINSEAVDGYSVTYQPSSLDKRIYDTLRLYLPQELLYRGI